MSPLRLIRSAASLAAADGPLRRWILTVFKALLVLGALYLAWRFASRVAWSTLADRLHNARWALLVPAILCLLGRLVAVHCRWSLALRRLAIEAPRFTRLMSLAAAMLVNHVTPAARLLGGVLRARYVAQRAGCRFSHLYATVLADQFSHHSVYILLTWSALVLTAWKLERPGLTALLAALPLAVLSSAGLWIRARRSVRAQGLLAWWTRRFAERRERRLGTLLASGRNLLRRLRELLSDRRLQGAMAGWSATHFLLNAGAQWLLFGALQHEISFATVVLAVASGAGAGLLSGTPGGLGTTEAAMIGCYTLLGVDQIDAAAATLLYRGLHYALILALGLPSLLYLEAHAKKPQN